MPIKPARAAWRRHELVTKAIFEALLRQKDAENLDVRDNVTIKGVKTCHQIDVAWKYRMGGLDHSVIVQVKKKKERAKKGDLLLFNSVLLDIPGQPRGVFVSEHGYQKGALEVARAAGIAAFEIREVNRGHASITVKSLSIARVTPSPDQYALEYTLFEPTITNVQMVLDKLWMAKNPEALPADTETLAIFTGARFLDAAGNERTSMRMLVQNRIREFGQAGQTQLEAEFPAPTYVSGIELLNKESNPMGDLKIAKLIATLDLTKTTRIMPLFTNAASTYLFRNAVEGDDHYVLIAEREADLWAVFSVTPRSIRLG